MMVETLFNNRKKYQGEMKAAKKELETCTDPARQVELKNTVSKFDIKQKATKIMMNSLYGAFGSEFFRFYDLDNAEAVTLTGQFIIQYVERGMNAFLNNLFKTDKVDYIIAGDTDSIYVNLEPLVAHVFPDWQKVDPAKITKFLDKVCKEKLEKKIESLFEEITKDYINGIWIQDKPILSMKREVIANPGIWTAKKHYILKVLNSEGDNFFECLDCHNKFSGPSEMVPCNKCKSTNVQRSYKLKIMGMEMVKSSMPKISRDAMKKAVEIVLGGTQEELVAFVDKTRAAFFSSPAEIIACPRGVKGLDKYADAEFIYGNKTPLHTKGVLLYNWYVKEKGLQTKYPYISNSDKIKYIYLKLPNPIREKVIAFPSKLPKEFGLEKYIDYQAMWDLTFISPITKILDPIGWTTEKKYDMDRFFA
jgi:DNA polymerase elongation subunit (family B)